MSAFTDEDGFLRGYAKALGDELDRESRMELERLRGEVLVLRGRVKDLEAVVLRFAEAAR